MSEPEFEKVVRDGKVAILVSHGFGAGWSTWGSPEKFLAMDSGLVALAERHAPVAEVDAYLKSKLGDEHGIYMGGWCPAVEWLPVGTQFYILYIHEYDGSESLHTSSDLVWTA